jgi:acetylornithine/N-succinyldiaminopimelate aminotransferase
MSTSNSDWAERGRHSWMGGAVRPDLCLVRGKGSRVWDSEGREYLDFVGGWAVCALGHAPAAVSRALADQSSLLLHCSPGFWNPTAVELAEKLTRMTGYERVFLGCTGAEANECAIKLARKKGAPRDAAKVVCAWDGFHGRTLATMAATGKPAWRNLFGPEMPGFVHIPYNDAQALHDAVGRDTCAVVFEPILGEGGVVAATPEFARAARDACDRTGALLVLDEVQTGLGRCGEMLFHRTLGIRADIATLAKGLGAGFPVSACLTDSVNDAFAPGDQGGTHTYHPLGAAVGLAVLGELEERDLPGAARRAGRALDSMLHSIAHRHGLSRIRGAGLLRAFDLPHPSATRLVDAAREEGLLLNAPKASSIRLMPPLTVSDADLEEFGIRLDKALDRVRGADVSGAKTGPEIPEPI